MKIIDKMLLEFWGRKAPNPAIDMPATIKSSIIGTLKYHPKKKPKGDRYGSYSGKIPYRDGFSSDHIRNPPSVSIVINVSDLGTMVDIKKLENLIKDLTRNKHDIKYKKVFLKRHRKDDPISEDEFLKVYKLSQVETWMSSGKTDDFKGPEMFRVAFRHHDEATDKTNWFDHDLFVILDGTRKIIETGME